MLKQQSPALSAMFAYQQLHHHFDCDEQHLLTTRLTAAEIRPVAGWSSCITATIYKHFDANVSTRVTRVS
jgi:hypothetical protein